MKYKSLFLLVLLMCFVSVKAHTPSSSYLFINEKNDAVQLRWDIAIRDLDHVIGLDANQDKSITWQELKNKRLKITAYAFSHLKIQQGKEFCRLEDVNLQIVNHSDGNYAVLNIQPKCQMKEGLLIISYSLLFDVDANHRGIIIDQRQQESISYIASPEDDVINLSENINNLSNVGTYVKQGIWHILIGFDHILFIITLMLPAVLLYRNKKWNGVGSFKPAMMSLFKVVTAFTIAHSITLTLATLEIISFPSRWVESAIALSVILVAINNIKPMFTHARWGMAFMFGLIHGLGFASVLSDLNLGNGSLILSLLGFNVGVEIGQGLILLLLFPIAYLLRNTKLYKVGILKGVSILITIIASLWFFQRVMV